MKVKVKPWFVFAHVCFQENRCKLSTVRGTIAIVIDLKKMLLTYSYRKQNYRDTAMSRPIVTLLALSGQSEIGQNFLSLVHFLHVYYATLQ